MARSKNSKDAVAASMKRRLNPDDYMSDPKKTSITWGDAEKNEPTRSYFHASNSLAQLRSRNPLPAQYVDASGGKAYGGMVNIDGQQYYQPGILNKEDIARRFEGRGVNSKENNYGLRGEEDKFTGRADSSIASMSPDELRELVGGVAMRVEDAENKRYANMFLKIHDAAVQNRERVLRGAEEKERLANAERIFARSDKEYMEDMDAGSERERRRTEEKERLADVQQSSDLRDAEYAAYGNWQDGVQRRADLEKAENAERRGVRDADRSEGEEVAGGGTRDAPISLWDAHKKAAKGTLSNKKGGNVDLGKLDPSLWGTPDPGQLILRAQKEGEGTPDPSQPILRAQKEWEGTAEKNQFTPKQRKIVDNILKKVHERIELYKKDAAEGTLSNKKGGNVDLGKLDPSLWGTPDPGQLILRAQKEGEGTPDPSQPILRAQKEWEGTAEKNQFTPKQRKIVDNILKKVHERIELYKKDAAEGTLSNKKGGNVDLGKLDPSLWGTPDPGQLILRAQKEGEGTPDPSQPILRAQKEWEGTAEKNQFTPKQRKIVDNILKKVHERIELYKKDAAEGTLSNKKGGNVDLGKLDPSLWGTPDPGQLILRAQKEGEGTPDPSQPILRAQKEWEGTAEKNQFTPKQRKIVKPPSAADAAAVSRRSRYVNGPYVDSASGRYVIGPEHPLFELEKQQQYRRGFVTKYNAEGGFYYTQFDKDVAYSYGVLNDE